MPIFEYKCKKCGHKKEFLERTGSSKKHTCENCGSNEMHRVFSTFSAGNSAKSGGSDSCPTGTCPLG